jgi:hypothetical protein
MARKTLVLLTTAAALAKLAEQTSVAQFHSGSDGSYGPLNVTSNTTLDLPPDGIFNCTSITVAQGTTLTFRRNPLNTPVFLLATSNILIQGVINVSGKLAAYGAGGEGGPGGLDGGMPPNGQGMPPGDGLGPGGGIGNYNDGGGAAYATQPSAGSTSLFGHTYGNTLLVPMVGGSGGGGAVGGGVTGFGGGGGGGGGLLLASDTRVTIAPSATLFAQGGNANHDGAGSGGAIRLVAPVVDGTGSLNVRGGSIITTGGSGGDGRIRVDATDRFALFLTYNGPVTIGKFMQVFPTNNPHLDVTQAAGTSIAQGYPSPVVVQLPAGSPTNQTISLQARNFTGIVPITVAVTPDAGPSARYDSQIDMAGGSLAQTNVPVVIPSGTACRIYAWTR